MVLALLRGRIGPEIPRADTNLLADVVNAVDGATRVTPRNDQGLCSAVYRVLDKLARERLPLALGRRDIDLPCSNQVVDDG